MNGLSIGRYVSLWKNLTKDGTREYYSFQLKAKHKNEAGDEVVQKMSFFTQEACQIIKELEAALCVVLEPRDITYD